jgi:hypothetical protein
VRRNSKFFGLVFIPAVLFVFFAIPTIVDLVHRTQSGQGTHSGVVVKLSYRGRINNSWEGQLMLGSVQSGEIWSFSLDPANPQTPSLAEQLQRVELAGSQVTLQYRQHFIWPWRTDTNYLVYGIIPRASRASQAR